MSEVPADIHQLLGKLVAEIEALKDRMDRSDHSQCMRERNRDAIIKKILEDVEALKAYMIENKGGRRMLLMLLTSAGAAGAVLTKFIQYLLTMR